MATVLVCANVFDGLTATTRVDFVMARSGVCRVAGEAERQDAW